MRLILFDLTVGSAIVIVLAIVGIGVVRANLRPLDDIELTAGQIAQGHLDHRVPEGDPRTEVGSLGRSLNAMLSQIERAFHAQQESEQAAHDSEERMRRFIADASHELRTPLTTIRGFAAHYRMRGGAGGGRRGVGVSAAGSAGAGGSAGAANGGGARFGGGAEDQSSRTDAWVPGSADEIFASGPTDDGMSPADLDHLIGRVEAEATRMGLLVEDLLTLARLDQQRPLNIAPVDLLTLAADAVQDARIVSPDRPIDLIVAPGTAFLVEGDEPRLRQVLGNLVNNAITHTPAGTPVRVKIASGTLPPAPGRRSGGPAPADGDGFAGDASSGAAASERPVPAVVLDVEDDGPGMTIGAGAARLRAVLPGRRGQEPRLRRHRPRPGDRGRPGERARRHGLGPHLPWPRRRLPGAAPPLPRRAAVLRRFGRLAPRLGRGARQNSANAEGLAGDRRLNFQRYRFTGGRRPTSRVRWPGLSHPTSAGLGASHQSRPLAGGCPTCHVR